MLRPPRAIVALVLIAAVAHADSRRPLAVRADRAWTPSGVQVQRGQALTITARGSVTSGTMSVGPDGAAGTQALKVDVDGSPPLPGAPPLALIARIGDGPAFAVGGQLILVAPRAGELAFGINDDTLADNLGEWAVSIADGTAAPASPLDNTTWRHCASGDPHDVTFVAGGAVAMAGADCGPARWTLEGARLVFDCNHVTRYEATLAGDELTGHWKTPSRRGTLCMRRVQARAKEPIATRAPTARASEPVEARPGVLRVEGTCPAGSHRRGDRCYACPKGSTWNGRSCARPCTAREHEWRGECYTCPPFSEWVGNGRCRETLAIPRECSSYVTKPSSCK